MQTTNKRTNVNVDDRRKVIVMARGRKPADIAKVKHEDFIRQELKKALGWGPKDSAPDSIKQTAKEMAQVIMREAKEAAAKQMAKLEAAIPQ